MKSIRSHFLKYFPLATGILILCIGAFFVPWHEVLPYFSRLSIGSYVSIFGLGTAYYLVRIIRYYYMLGVLKAPRSLRQTLLAYFIAQPVSLLPAGEAYRIVTLKRHVKVPTSKGISIVFIQSFTENVALVVLALISAVALKQQVIVILGLMLLYLVIFVLLRSRRTAENSRRLLNRLPFVSFAQTKFHSFIKKNKTLLSGNSLVVLFLSGFASSLLAIILLFIVANDLGIQLDFTQAIIAFALPTVLQNVSFLPGGIGVNEQSTVGILVILGSSLPAAVALTLIMRFVTLILGVVLGLISILISKKELV
jgi:uncharacterized protein (TIRG00374 family)